MIVTFSAGTESTLIPDVFLPYLTFGDGKWYVKQYSRKLDDQQLVVLCMCLLCSAFYCVQFDEMLICLYFLYTAVQIEVATDAIELNSTSIGAWFHKVNTSLAFKISFLHV